MDYDRARLLRTAYDQRDFFEELHGEIMSHAPEPIPEATMKRLDRLTAMMDRETEIIKKLEPGDE